MSSPLKYYFVRHFFPSLLFTGMPFDTNHCVQTWQSASLMNPDVFFFIMQFGGTFVAFVMLITKRKGGNDK